MNAITTLAAKAHIKGRMAMYAMAGFATALLAEQSHALSKTDLTQDQSGGKTFDDMASNIDGAAQSGASLVISLVTIGGFVVVAVSLYTLWKASKDEREKPLGAVAGVFLGGAMAAAGPIMWITRNTLVK